MRTIYIYTLAHPLTSEIRYVGKTDNLAERFSTHTTSNRAKGYCTNWIKSLRLQGLRPVMEVLDSVPESEWVRTEQYWIAQLRAWGFRLTNLTEGGEGSYGRTPPHTQTEWYRKLTSERHKGKVLSQETRNRVSRGLTGKKQSQATKQKRSQRHINLQAQKSTRILHTFKPTGEFCGTFRTGNGLARMLGYPVSTIQMYLTGRNKSVRDLIIHTINCVSK